MNFPPDSGAARCGQISRRANSCPFWERPNSTGSPSSSYRANLPGLRSLDSATKYQMSVRKPWPNFGSALAADLDALVGAPSSMCRFYAARVRKAT